MSYIQATKVVYLYNLGFILVLGRRIIYLKML